MIKLSIITPKGLYKELETPIINVNSKDGRRGLLSNHISTCFIIEESHLETEENNVRNHYAVGDGVIYLKNNECKLLVDYAICSSDIDINKIKNQQQKLKTEIDGLSGSKKEACIASLNKTKNLLKVAEYAKQG